MSHWIDNAIFYHIYPLGATNAPQINDHTSQPFSRIAAIHGWLDHIQSLGANAIYLGPVFESTRHGYDTANYYEVDRRLGTRADLAALSADLHARNQNGETPLDLAVKYEQQRAVDTLKNLLEPKP